VFIQKKEKNFKPSKKNGYHRKIGNNPSFIKIPVLKKISENTFESEKNKDKLPKALKKKKIKNELTKKFDFLSPDK